ncbi:hypothetical protein MAGR_40820 [Mycolicibacterium agri]|uniref:Uncharacterized protein n=1 Tax=Mycolicibacterium agri TaxID=36811 RepID=A0A7I9W4M7_MYCAG|nr:hypothetical protein MAGR_40820 [Mycolicibacterium agri]
MPSAISVAQLMVAPCAESVIWPKSSGPMPSAIEMPCAAAIQISRPMAPRNTIDIWMIAVYASAISPPVPV